MSANVHLGMNLNSEKKCFFDLDKVQAWPMYAQEVAVAAIKENIDRTILNSRPKPLCFTTTRGNSDAIDFYGRVTSCMRFCCDVFILKMASFVVRKENDLFFTPPVLTPFQLEATCSICSLPHKPTVI